MRVRFLISALLLIAVSSACGRRSLDGKLIDAAAEGDAVTVQKLLDSGASIDAHARDDWTPVTTASREGKLGVVKLLLERGANVNTKEGGGHTALFWARKYQHRDVEEALLAAGGREE
jgi:ankyrin repeat protein